MERQLVMLLEQLDPGLYDSTIALYQDRIEYSLPAHVNVIRLDKKPGIDLGAYRRIFSLVSDPRYDLVIGKGIKLNETLMFMSALCGRKHLAVEIRSSGSWMRSVYRRMNWVYRVTGRSWPVVCNSRKAVAELAEILPGHVPVNVIPNGIDTDRFKPRRIERPDSTPVIGFVGRISPVKNIETLIAGQAALVSAGVECRLILVGHVDDEEYRQKLVDLIRGYELESRVEWLPPVENIEDVYPRFDLFVLPSIVEGAPNALLEAMACGLPCLASTGANTDRFVMEPYEFPEDDAEDLARKIEGLINSEQERTRTGLRNREYILRKHSLVQLASDYREFIENAILDRGRFLSAGNRNVDR